MVDVFEWLFASGNSFGCGTAVEFDYWKSQGVVEENAKLGNVICQEPASEDARRKIAWGI